VQINNSVKHLLFRISYSSLLFNFAVGWTFMKNQENQHQYEEWVNISIPGHRRYNIQVANKDTDSLCGLVVRVPGYKSRGPGFDFRRYQIFLVGLERGPLSLVRIMINHLNVKLRLRSRKPWLTAVGIRSVDHAAQRRRPAAVDRWV
jgi:hypothetical protein